VVTTFEFKPSRRQVQQDHEPGRRPVARDARRVGAHRTHAGKSTVGIQIPNQHREPISLRELLESEAYQSAPSKLTVALGKTIQGEPFLGDLSTMPTCSSPARPAPASRWRSTPCSPASSSARRRTSAPHHDRSQAPGARMYEEIPTC